VYPYWQTGHAAYVPSKVRSKIRITPAFIYKKLSSFSVQYNIHVMPCTNKIYAENTAYRIMREVYNFYHPS